MGVNGLNLDSSSHKVGLRQLSTGQQPARRPWTGESRQTISGFWWAAGGLGRDGAVGSALSRSRRSPSSEVVAILAGGHGWTMGIAWAMPPASARRKKPPGCFSHRAVQTLLALYGEAGVSGEPASCTLPGLGNCPGVGPVHGRTHEGARQGEDWDAAAWPLAAAGHRRPCPCPEDRWRAR